MSGRRDEGRDLADMLVGGISGQGIRSRLGECPRPPRLAEPRVMLRGSAACYFSLKLAVRAEPSVVVSVTV